jgi:hypothetical protein
MDFASNYDDSRACVLIEAAPLSIECERSAVFLSWRTVGGGPHTQEEENGNRSVKPDQMAGA